METEYSIYITYLTVSRCNDDDNCVICGCGKQDQDLFDFIYSNISKRDGDNKFNYLSNKCNEFVMHSHSLHKCHFTVHPSCWVEYLNCYNLTEEYPCPACSIVVKRPFYLISLIDVCFTNEHYTFLDNVYQKWFDEAVVILKTLYAVVTSSK